MKTISNQQRNIIRMILSLTLLSNSMAFSQNTFPVNGSTGVGTSSPHASSILEVKSTAQGVLFPRMTKAQRDAIVNPAQGLIIYQTDNITGIYCFDGIEWKAASNEVRGINDNMFIGLAAGNSNTTGKSNIGLGRGALRENTYVSGLIAI